MAKKPLTDYGNQLYSYGLGRNFFDNKPVTRKQMALAAIPEDPRTLVDNIRRLQMYGGLSGADMPVKNKAFSPYVVPENVEEATKQVATAGGFEPDLTGAKFDKEGNLIGETPDDFVPFNTDIFDEKNAEILKNLKPGEKPPTKSIMGLMGASDEALAQLGVAENEKAERAEEFRAQEAKIAEAQGMPQENLVGEGGEKDGEKAIEKLFEQSMEDYITNARGVGPEKRTKDLAEYKREFAEATGIDISGKVDKSAALMSLGLALMQNRAGKGFNVGRMLSEFGKAGEAAMPALEKAKTQARNDAIAAGKYALQTRASDRATDAANQEKLMNRGKYWVYKKGAKGAEFSEFDKGEFVDLNKFELNKLVNTPDFDKNYAFIDADDRFDILKTRAEALDKDPEKSWSSKGYDRISLIGGDPKETPYELTVQGVMRDANYELKPGEYNMKLGETKESVIDRMIGYQNGINKDMDKFEGLIENINQGVSIPKQVIDRVKGFFRAIGYTPPDGMPGTTQQARQQLKNFSIDNATEILKESGKTLSDGDRRLVNERVGQIDFFNADPALIMNQIRDVYNFTVQKSQNNLDQAIRALGRDFGVFVYPAGQDDIPENQEELDAMNKKFGTNYTMDDYKK